MLPNFPKPPPSRPPTLDSLPTHRFLDQGLSTLAGAVLLSLAALLPLDANALALGRLVVQSALGEPLRAEIDLAQVTPAEAASLNVGLAPAAAFRAAGLEFNPSLNSVTFRVQRRADGRAYILVTGTRTINEPFLDLILEANWGSGRIVRDYTLLFDPPTTRTTPAPATEPLSAVTLPPAQAPAQAPEPEPATATPVARSAPAAATQARSVPEARPATAMAAQRANTSKSVTVRVGDTAGRIAHTVKPSSVSLDQMLVAMLRQNPQAFIDGNINRIKAGAIVDVPDAQAAGEVSADEAKRIIAAQSKDFDAFRRRLATAVPRVPAANTQQQVTGKVQSEVTDKKAASPSADQLKLSKAATASSTAAEDTIAREREAQATADRAAELTRNLAELAKIGAATPAPAPAPVSATAVAPAPALATESATPLPTPAPAPAEPVVAAPAAPAEPAVAAPAVPAPTEPPPAPAVAVETNAFPSEEPGLLSEFTSNPLVLPAAGGLLALLAGFGAWRWHQRRKQSSPDSSYLESRIQPDSFFGASGGQNVNTVEVVAQGSSLMYSPSQLDAGGDVDPVAEADVYLAYGRDLQAEEILKEALRTNPTRVAIHSKMLEIYAKRRDAKSFEILACEVYALAHGNGPEWEHACQLGQELDPANPMYQPGGSPAARGGAAEHDADVTPGMANTRPFDPPAPPPAESDSALDLDLDFSVDEAAKTSATDTNAPENSVPFDAIDTPPTNSDGAVTDTAPPPFDLSAADLSFEGNQPQTDSEPVTQSDDLASSDGNLSDFELSFADENPPTTQLEINPSVVDQEGNAAGPTFDMGDLSLDLGPETPADDGTLDDIPAGDPLETKLSLAAEFLAIGDMEGARSLAEEVVEQATGALQAKARTFLSDLS